jgi:hypothetical protein
LKQLCAWKRLSLILGLIAIPAAGAAQVAISINDVSLAEGNSGTTSFTFTVSLSEPAGGTVTVNYATANGTGGSAATLADLDYQQVTSTTLTFLAGETSMPATVLVNGDCKVEGQEFFLVNLTSPTGGATISDNQGRGFINNDEPNNDISIGSVILAEGNSGQTTFNFPVTLVTNNACGSADSVTVNYTTSSDTATLADGDYEFTFGTLTFTPDFGGPPQTQFISVLVNGDCKSEGQEIFEVLLSGAVNAGISENEGNGIISNDDIANDISIGDVTLAEGVSGQTTFNFPVTLVTNNCGTAPDSVTVNYTTANGSGGSAATLADSDYQSTSGTLTFTPNPGGPPQTQFISVLVNGDCKPEGNETFVVNLSGAVNAAISDTQGSGTISNDDIANDISIGDVTLDEGNSGQTTFNFPVTLVTNNDCDIAPNSVTVNYTTANGSGGSAATLADSDYQLAFGTLTFTPNPGGPPQTQFISVLVNGDCKPEGNETFVVNLSGAVNAAISDTSGSGTISNDEAANDISIGDVTLAEGNSGQTTFNFPVTLVTNNCDTAPNSVTVNYATANGTATLADSDYQFTSGTLTFTPNPGGPFQTQNISVFVNGDCTPEGSENFRVNLSSAVNAAISDSQGIGTITDDEGSGSLSISDLTVSEPSTGSADAVFTVSLANGCVGVPVSVSYDVAAGTATDGPLGTGDFSSVSGTLTITPPATTGTILVPIHSDALVEPQETFFVNLSSPVNATIADDQATGTITDPAASFFTLTPCRVADTRNPSGPFGGPALVANSARDFQVTGQCGVPATAKAVALNVTIVDPNASGDLRIYPTGTAQPLVSTINFGPNQVRANNTVMPLSATGQMTVFCAMPSGSTNFLFDVSGYFE